MVDIVAMPTWIGQKKYLVLAQEDLTNQVEGRALRTYSREAGGNFQEADRRQTLCIPIQDRQRGAIGQ